MATRNKRILAVARSLPSDAAIHFIAFVVLTMALLFWCAKLTLSTVYTNDTGVTGWATVLLLYAGAASSALIGDFGRHVAAPLAFPMRLVMRLIGKHVAPRVQYFLITEQSAGLETIWKCYRALWLRVGSGAPPPLYWFFSGNGINGSMVRIRGRDGIALSAGLLAVALDRPHVFNFTVLHEFAHLRNADGWLFRSVDACCRTFTVATLTAVAFALLDLSYRLSHPIGGMFGWLSLPIILSYFYAFLLLVVIGLWLMIRRYAGVVVALQESAADAFAASWTEAPAAALASVFTPASQRESKWRRVRSLWSLNLVHLSASERFALIDNPRAFLRPKPQYFIASIAALFVTTENPLAAIRDASLVHVVFEIAWAFVFYAFLLEIARAFMASALTNDPLVVRPSWLFEILVLLAVPFLPFYDVFSAFHINAPLSSVEYDSPAAFLAAQRTHLDLLLLPAITWLTLTVVARCIATTQISTFDQQARDVIRQACRLLVIAATLAAIVDAIAIVMLRFERSYDGSPLLPLPVFQFASTHLLVVTALPLVVFSAATVAMFSARRHVA